MFSIKDAFLAERHFMRTNLQMLWTAMRPVVGEGMSCTLRHRKAWQSTWFVHLDLDMFLQFVQSQP